jgi:hypothetical protein
MVDFVFLPLLFHVAVFAGPEKQVVKIDPFGAKCVSSICIQDPYQGSSMSYKAEASLHQDDASVLEVARICAEKNHRALNEFKSKTVLNDEATLSEIIAICESKRVRFFDTDFPASAKSIFEGEGDHPFPMAVWYRPEDFFIGSYRLYDGIDPKDVGQGRLGDCWLCCSIASIAEDPDLIQRIFGGTVNANAVGAYEMILYPGGNPQRMIVDDFFPCAPGQGPLFMHSKTLDKGELWPMLLEKAYANLCGSYYALKSGQPSEAFATLTGLPVVHYQPQTFKGMSDDDLWNLMSATASQVKREYKHRDICMFSF